MGQLQFALLAWKNSWDTILLSSIHTWLSKWRVQLHHYTVFTLSPPPPSHNKCLICILFSLNRLTCCFSISAITCPTGSTYRESMTACSATCGNPGGFDDCFKPNVEGCECNSGYVLNGATCIPVGDCTCESNGVFYAVRKRGWGLPVCFFCSFVCFFLSFLSLSSFFHWSLHARTYFGPDSNKHSNPAKNSVIKHAGQEAKKEFWIVRMIFATTSMSLYDCLICKHVL